MVHLPAAPLASPQVDKCAGAMSGMHKRFSPQREMLRGPRPKPGVSSLQASFPLLNPTLVFLESCCVQTLQRGGVQKPAPDQGVVFSSPLTHPAPHLERTVVRPHCMVPSTFYLPGTVLIALCISSLQLPHEGVIIIPIL